LVWLFQSSNTPRNAVQNQGRNVGGCSSSANMGVMPNLGHFPPSMTPTAGVITLALVLGVNLGVFISASLHPPKFSARFREKSVGRLQWCHSGGGPQHKPFASPNDTNCRGDHSDTVDVGQSWCGHSSPPTPPKMQCRIQKGVSGVAPVVPIWG